ncbi:hypothetical protein N9N67_09090, partial [Bacteriovoracaceae bacterium]|nr:hypothetical protein [Bacteriovoracaceae bacterium]
FIFSFSAFTVEKNAETNGISFEPHTLVEGEWISKLLADRNLMSPEMLEATFAKNGINAEIAKRLNIGDTIQLPVENQSPVNTSKEAVVENEVAKVAPVVTNAEAIVETETVKADQVEEDVVETKESAINKIDDEVEAEEANSDDNASINARIGVFSADDRFHERNADITRNINTRVMVGGEISTNSDLVKSVILNGYAEVYDTGRLSNDDKEDRLNNSYGISVSTPFSLTNKLALAPEIMANSYNSYDFNDKEKLKERSDNNGWIGLILSYQMGEFTPYAKYSHLGTTDDSSNDFDALQASMNKLGLDYNKGSFVTGLYWQYTDWNMETKDFTRDIGLNIGYRF